MFEIAAIVPYKFLPCRSGGQKYIARFYESLGEHVKINIICTVNNDLADEHNYHLIPLLKRSVTRYIDPALFFRLKKIIRDKQIKVLVIEHPYLGWLGYLLKKTTGVKLIVHSHNIEGLRFKSLGKWWWPLLLNYEMWVHRQADCSFFIQENDRMLAIKKFRLSPALTDVITYGIDWNTPPSATEKNEAKKYLQDTHNIKEDEKILLFTGAFNYKPNVDALHLITSVINPALIKQQGFKYKILICGKDVPPHFISANYPNVIFTGFTKTIKPYYTGSDIFINPVTDGGGIKTKLVEALASDLYSVSTISGAIGVDPAICNNKLLILSGNDWPAFANAIIHAPGTAESIDPVFFDHFYWGNITAKASEHILKYA
ncbi:MAG: glycosyltransferase family 4 protein [Chitinophagaceae bacterium]|nr:glycosyltransferase family 4 protein [Chitinophagaceae bacterium]